MVWTGRALSAPPVLIMVFGASMKLTHAPSFTEQWTGTLGYPESTATSIGLLELVCVLLYVVPRTAVLGAVLVTGYLGGAIATHVRIADPGFVTPLVLGVVAWVGLYLRDPRLRDLRSLWSLRRPRREGRTPER
jgi:hypothetical protein